MEPRQTCLELELLGLKVVKENASSDIQMSRLSNTQTHKPRNPKLETSKTLNSLNPKLPLDQLEQQTCELSGSSKNRGPGPGPQKR